ncbi:MAG: phosphatase PAP2 family protein, partial [Bacteroidota bacterium]
FVRLVGTDCGDDFGFFAQRSCFAFALVTYIFLALRHKFNGLKFILVVWVILVSYSRVYVGVHYPLNVLSAGGIGILSGIFVFRVYEYFKNSLLLI